MFLLSFFSSKFTPAWIYSRGYWSVSESLGESRIELTFKASASWRPLRTVVFPPQLPSRNSRDLAMCVCNYVNICIYMYKCVYIYRNVGSPFYSLFTMTTHLTFESVFPRFRGNAGERATPCVFARAYAAVPKGCGRVCIY